MRWINFLSNLEYYDNQDELDGVLSLIDKTDLISQFNNNQYICKHNYFLLVNYLLFNCYVNV